MSLLLLLGMALVLAPSALLRRTEALAVEKARSLDLLESEQRESARREAAYRKAQELELLGRITGTVAHDFNNTLTVVLAAVAELERKPSSADVTEVLADLRSAALAATCSVQHLQVFGPPRTTQRTEIPVAALLERSCAGLRRALPKTIEVKLEILAEPVVRANEGHLQQVFANLALNARDAMRKGGRLTLRVREVEGGAWAAVDVIDTGVGMSDEVKEHLFEPFFTTKGDHGTGLGLAAVKERVQAEGGRIAVTSEVGAGTTITVSLPAIRRGIADG
jgi:signal transduction histidine kinase